jgi:transglutaminase/protease-like cytokinesis protein 3
MKLLQTVLLLLIANLAFSQARSVNLNNIEEFTSPATLAKFLIASDTTDRQKVRSIFKWITDNIAYNVKSFQNRGQAFSTDYWLEEDDDTTAILKPLNERVSEMVLKRRTAVCDGYARLFKSLCDYAGIRCETITGYTKTYINRIGVQFKSNHKWNAVFIDTKWYLLDATWASGYINYRDEFEREYNAHYFLTPPDEFILDHYPEDLRWALLPEPPTFKEFNYTPFKTAAFNRNYILSFKPENGIIEASVGDSIKIELETTRPKRNLWVIDIPYVDSDAIWVMQCCGVEKPVNSIKGNKVSYTYRVASDKVEWLNIIYDDEMIMRYKLNVRKDIHQENTMKVKQQ